MKRKTGGLGSLLALVLGSGCATTVTLPVNRMESPEAVGEKVFRLDPLAIEGGHQVTFTPDSTSIAMNTSRPPIKAVDANYRMDAGYGVSPQIDLAIKIQNDTPLMIQGKYQFFGEPRVSSTEGNFSGAGTLALGKGKDSSTSGFGSSNADFYVVDLAGILGYRLTHGLLGYGGAFAGWYPMSAEQKIGSAASQSYSSTPHNVGMNLGIGLDYGGIDLKLEGAWAHTVAGASSLSSLQAGFKFGLALGNPRPTE